MAVAPKAHPSSGGFSDHPGDAIRRVIVLLALILAVGTWEYVPRLKLIDTLIGKVLVACVDAGMGQRWMFRVFGPPSGVGCGFCSGIGPEAVQSDDYSYSRYGVTVSFTYRLGDHKWFDDCDTPPQRVHGNILP